MTRPESVPNPDPEPHVPPASRRAFLAGAGAVTVAGAAVVTGGAGGAVAAVGAPAGTVTTSDGDDAVAASGPAVVAYVRNLAGGEVRLMSGEREVVVHDHALARSLARHVDARLDAQEG